MARGRSLCLSEPQRSQRPCLPQGVKNKWDIHGHLVGPGLCGGDAVALEGLRRRSSPAQCTREKTGQARATGREPNSSSCFVYTAQPWPAALTSEGDPLLLAEEVAPVGWAVVAAVKAPESWRSRALQRDSQAWGLERPTLGPQAPSPWAHPPLWWFLFFLSSSLAMFQPHCLHFTSTPGLGSHLPHDL